MVEAHTAHIAQISRTAYDSAVKMSTANCLLPHPTAMFGVCVHVYTQFLARLPEIHAEKAIHKRNRGCQGADYGTFKARREMKQ